MRHKQGRLWGFVATVMAFLGAVAEGLCWAMYALARERQDVRWWKRALRREYWRAATRGFGEGLRHVYWRLLCTAQGIPAVMGGATSALSAFGATVSWNAQTIVELTAVGLPQQTATKIDVTSNDSPNKFREFIAGIRDGGVVSLEGIFIPGDTNGQIAMHTDFQAGTKRTVVITFAAAFAATWTFDAIITAFSQSQDMDGTAMVKFDMQITGKPVLAVTASANLTTLTGIEENAGAALTFAPVFAGGTYAYMITVNAASTWIKLTPTLAGATFTITQDSDSNSQTVASGAQSGTIALTNAVVTVVTLSVKETGKVAKLYKLYVYNA